MRPAPGRGNRTPLPPEAMPPRFPKGSPFFFLAFAVAVALAGPVAAQAPDSAESLAAPESAPGSPRIADPPLAALRPGFAFGVDHGPSPVAQADFAAWAAVSFLELPALPLAPRFDLGGRYKLQTGAVWREGAAVGVSVEPLDRLRVRVAVPVLGTFQPAVQFGVGYRIH